MRQISCLRLLRAQNRHPNIVELQDVQTDWNDEEEEAGGRVPFLDSTNFDTERRLVAQEAVSPKEQGSIIAVVFLVFAAGSIRTDEASFGKRRDSFFQACQIGTSSFQPQQRHQR